MSDEHQGEHEPAEASDSNPKPVLRDERGWFVSGTGKPQCPKKHRGPGAVPGNLNHAPNPWVTFWNRRALRIEDRWAARIAGQYAGEIAADKGDPSAGEKKIIEVAAVARACECLVLDALRAEGGVSSKRGLDLLQVLAKFQTLEVRALNTLGLQRRARQVDPLTAIKLAVARANEAVIPVSPEEHHE